MSWRALRKAKAEKKMAEQGAQGAQAVQEETKVHPSIRAREDLITRGNRGSGRLFRPRFSKDSLEATNPALRTQFRELQRLLQKSKDPEAIWQYYEKLRQSDEALSCMSPDLYRLIILHFKTVGNAAAKASRARTLSSSVAQKTKVDQKTWAARITTVLVDKREHSQDREFTRWEISDMMSALNRGERYEETLQELSRCLASGVSMDPILLNHAVRAWGGLGRLDKALELIQDKKYQDVAKASEYTLGYLLQQFLLNGQREKALDLWVAIRTLPMEDPKTAEGILRTCATTKEVDFAQMVYEELSKMGVETTVDALDIMAGMAISKASSGADRAQILQTIFSRMSGQDKQVFRSSTLESILVNFCKKGDMEGAMLVVHLMDHYGLPTTNLHYHNALLRGFSQAGDRDGAIQWLNYMRREGCAPDLTSYHILIMTFVRHRRPREAEALFRQMLMDRLQPDRVLCNQMLLAYEHAKMTKRCLHLYQAMFRDHLGLDHESYSCLFNAMFHQHKSVQEGGEGFGTSMDNRRFLALVTEPIAKPRRLSLADSGAVAQDGAKEAQAIYPVKRQEYLYPNSKSHTTDLNPRSIFRDMIIVGVLPTLTLYGNILRTFLSQDDAAGAYVALRAMTDFHMLKPTPKISAIVLSWIYAELERRGPSGANAVTKGELTKLGLMMGRTRGLIDMLEKMVNTEKQQMPEEANRRIQDSLSTTQTSFGREQGKGKNNQASPPAVDMDEVNRAVQEMGGDIVDLFQRGAHSGSAQQRIQDQEMPVDLIDFERWFESYLPRIKRPSIAGPIDDEDADLD
ncbi:hypothetical protein DFQ27_003680 [Actinomortierella ambigua]|uniref:Pentatricopeptide repeat protein n=1 Tax=Actinomortierella ambigua TaxID=1343610 RepID=A0A9P6U556_9FUNG|nr:hypothetical protein DFQ27_003680 [Actinomortierella ambigua]